MSQLADMNTQSTVGMFHFYTILLWCFIISTHEVVEVRSVPFSVSEQICQNVIDRFEPNFLERQTFGQVPID